MINPPIPTAREPFDVPHALHGYLAGGGVLVISEEVAKGIGSIALHHL